MKSKPYIHHIHTVILYDYSLCLHTICMQVYKFMSYIYVTSGTLGGSVACPLHDPLTPQSNSPLPIHYNGTNVTQHFRKQSIHATYWPFFGPAQNPSKIFKNLKSACTLQTITLNLEHRWSLCSSPIVRLPRPKFKLATVIYIYRDKRVPWALPHVPLHP